jgi:hypothetical protein
MPRIRPGRSGLFRPLVSGAVAGMATTLVFTVVHQIVISDIWFSVLPMLGVGALCGMALAWSYDVVFDRPTARTWILYNTAYLAALILLGVLSVWVFEPVTTAAALMAAGGPPPPELFDRGLPFTAVYTVAAAGVISLLWARTWPKTGAVLLATAAILFLFGLNISILGLVEMSGEGYRALAEFFGLTVLVLAGNAAAVLILERRTLLRREA